MLFVNMVCLTVETPVVSDSTHLPLRCGTDSACEQKRCKGATWTRDVRWCHVTSRDAKGLRDDAKWWQRPLIIRTNGKRKANRILCLGGYPLPGRSAKPEMAVCRASIDHRWWWNPNLTSYCYFSHSFPLSFGSACVTAIMRTSAKIRTIERVAP
jgi:hypothetical protein